MNSYLMIAFRNQESFNENHKNALTSSTCVTVRTPRRSLIQKTHLYCGTNKVLNANESNLILYMSLCKI